MVGDIITSLRESKIGIASSASTQSTGGRGSSSPNKTYQYILGMVRIISHVLVPSSVLSSGCDSRSLLLLLSGKEPSVPVE